jgi:hypothetical protein
MSPQPSKPGGVAALALGRGAANCQADADDNVIERRVVPYPYPTREEAVAAIECMRPASLKRDALDPTAPPFP